MPGSIYVCECPGCRRRHEISTGASVGRDGSPWVYVQMSCASCGVIVSVPDSEGSGLETTVCERCGGELECWAGRVWHERSESGFTGPERVEGPCPGCRTPISNAHPGAVIEIGLWD